MSFSVDTKEYEEAIARAEKAEADLAGLRAASRLQNSYTYDDGIKLKGMWQVLGTALDEYMKGRPKLSLAPVIVAAFNRERGTFGYSQSFWDSTIVPVLFVMAEVAVRVRDTEVAVDAVQKE